MFSMPIEVANNEVVRMFVDPASISTGWAVFQGARFVESGSVVVPKRMPAMNRLVLIYAHYEKLRNRFDPSEVHIEQFGGRPSHILHWSVGVIGVALKTSTNVVTQDVPVKAWQKHVDWEGDRAQLKTFITETEDEQAAVGMGLYWVSA